MSAVTGLIHRVAGSPARPGSSTGVCRACGAEGIGLPFCDWVRDTFNDHDKLRPGAIICHACLFCFEEASTLLAERTGKDKPQRMRNYSHFVINGEWFPLTKGEKRRMVEMMRRKPDAVVIAVSGQKHILFRARPGWWQIEERTVLPFPGVLWPLLDVVEQLYSGGFSKEELETGRYSQHRMMQFGLAGFMNLEARLRPHRGALPLQFALFLAQKMEVENDAGL